MLFLFKYGPWEIDSFFLLFLAIRQSTPNV